MDNFWAVMSQEADVLASLKAGRNDILNEIVILKQFGNSVLKVFQLWDVEVYVEVASLI